MMIHMLHIHIPYDNNSVVVRMCDYKKSTYSLTYFFVCTYTWMHIHTLASVVYV